MEANKKYTALEILKETGETKFSFGDKDYSAEDVFGKGRIRIGGIPGIVDPNHLVRVPEEMDELEVIVGVESYKINTKKNAKDSENVSEEAKKVIESRAEYLSEQIEKNIKRKEEELTAKRVAEKEEKEKARTEG